MAAGTAPPVGGGVALKEPEVIERLTKRYGEKIRIVGSSKAPQVFVDRGHLLPVLTFLRDDPDLAFDFLVDVTAVDYQTLELPGIRERFCVVYQLLSLRHGHRFRLKTEAPEDDARVPSASALWKSALWGEREVHDMFGIRFEGNPDLRRLLMPADYPGFPLRKDYPVKGRGERDKFPQYRPEPPPGRAGGA
jgi:NADH-quinone oxidoreductase subunit C